MAIINKPPFDDAPEDRDDFIGTPRQRYWGAASVNNESNEFKLMTSDLAEIGKKLDIVIYSKRGFGSAPMNSSLFGQYAPDLFIGTNQINTRRLQELLFHELTHASHFFQNGPIWWDLVIAQTSSNISNLQLDLLPFELDFGDPWGNGNETFGEVVGLAESWAEHVSRDLIFPDADNENEVLWGNGASWVPTGFHHDLIDDGIEPVATGITDNIQGFTRQQLFNQINSSTLTFDDYFQNLSTILPPGNNQVDLSTLFLDYNL